MMRTKACVFPVILLVGCLPLLAQRDRRSGLTQVNDIEVTRSATLRILVVADPTNVFDYLVDARKLETWFADQAVSEAQLGGRYHLRWDDRQGVWSGRYTYFVRGNSLNYTWEVPGDGYESSVQIKLTPQPGGTLVELTHGGFTSNPAMDREIKDWTFYLNNLRSVIENGVDLRPELRKPPARRRTR